MVLGIIGLLVAVFAVFMAPDARERARESSCGSNLKQMGLAMMMYAADYDHTPGAPAAQRLMPYTKNTQIFVCPTAPRREPAGPADVPTDYFFVPDLALDDRVSSVAAGDDAARHRDGGNIGYLGGYVKRHEADEWRRLAGPHLPPAPAEAEGD